MMRTRRALGWVLGMAVLLIPSAALRAQWTLDAETGLVWSGYNDVRIPGDGGTLFSLSRDLTAKSGAFVRARLTWQLHPRHALSVLYAPLVLTASGSVGKTLLFNGETFSPGTPLAGRYMFNSYRLTYRYTLVDGARVRFGIGVTAKIRDAGIRIEGGGVSTEKTNVGFVPLINFRLDWKLAEALGLILEGDALAAPQGRAEDVFLGLGWDIAKGLTLKAGYRFVEGGAENAEVYNFTWVNYAAVGILARF